MINGSPSPGEASGTEQAAPKHRTRTAAVWTALAIGALLLIALIIFIAQNEHEAKITFVTAHVHLPLGIALLVAAVGGSLITLIVGTTRIAQLRLQLRRHRRRAAQERETKEAAGPSERL